MNVRFDIFIDYFLHYSSFISIISFHFLLFFLWLFLHFLSTLPFSFSVRFSPTFDRLSFLFSSAIFCAAFNIFFSFIAIFIFCHWFSTGFRFSIIFISLLSWLFHYWLSLIIVHVGFDIIFFDAFSFHFSSFRVASSMWVDFAAVYHFFIIVAFAITKYFRWFSDGFFHFASFSFLIDDVLITVASFRRLRYFRTLFIFIDVASMTFLLLSDYFLISFLHFFDYRVFIISSRLSSVRCRLFSINISFRRRGHASSSFFELRFYFAGRLLSISVAYFFLLLLWWCFFFLLRCRFRLSAFFSSLFSFSSFIIYFHFFFDYFDSFSSLMACVFRHFVLFSSSARGFTNISDWLIFFDVWWGSFLFVGQLSILIIFLRFIFISSLLFSFHFRFVKMRLLLHFSWFLLSIDWFLFFHYFFFSCVDAFLCIIDEIRGFLMCRPW